MPLYANLNGDSNVYAYEMGIDYIRVQFNGTRKIYQYSYLKAGMFHVEQMKILAESGRGLNSYITRNVRNLYD
jgi:hypothetical protein